MIKIQILLDFNLIIMHFYSDYYQFPMSLIIITHGIFATKTAVQADTIGRCFDPNLKAKGRKDFLKRNRITEVTPQMIAYTALQVFQTIYCIAALTLLPYRHTLDSHP